MQKSKKKASGNGISGGIFGGNMWESNPPGRFLAPLTGFEDRGAHQHPATPMESHHITDISKMQDYFIFYR